MREQDIHKRYGEESLNANGALDKTTRTMHMNEYFKSKNNTLYRDVRTPGEENIKRRK